MASADDGKFKAMLIYITKSYGILGVVRWLRYYKNLFTNPEFRRSEIEFRRSAPYRRFLQFKHQYRKVLQYKLNNSVPRNKQVLIFGCGFPKIEMELGLIKALELSGFIPTVVCSRYQRLDIKYYKLAGVKDFYFWQDFIDPSDFATAEAVLNQFQSVYELMTFQYANARVGQLACSTAIRKLRVGTLDMQSSRDRGILVKCVDSSMRHARAAQEIVRNVHPALALFIDGVYTPEGEILDNCLAHGIETIFWDVAHKSNSLIFKRYTSKESDQHHCSLSPESWSLVRKMEWTDVHRERIQRELYDSYVNGDWYSACGTQFDTHLMDIGEIQKQLGLDPAKKTAFIFPHILWDPALFQDHGLFQSFEEWLIETVRMACGNNRVNWVIKIHPAHVGKGVVEGFHGEPAELIALRKHIPNLPPHLFMLHATTNLSTFSLLRLMDYCVTVRGTIGIEAAMLGIPVLTAGAGRYSHKGFTIDSKSREEYLEKLAKIQEIPPLSPAQRELAERFAYGTFVLRPLPMRTVTLEYPREDQSSEAGQSRTQINVKTRHDWYSAPDLRAFSKWITESKQEDFLMPISSIVRQKFIGLS